MKDRRRLVPGKRFDYYMCDVHGWSFEDDGKDSCPVCLGEQLERKRIVEIIDKETGHYGQTHYEGVGCRMCRLIDLIRDDL